MTIKNVICDIDGVLMHDNVAVPGAAEFLHGIMDKGLPLVLLTNYPSQTGQDLANRFATAGVDVPDSVFYTSAMATADFLRRQEGKKAYVVGEGALIHELYKAGFTITDVNPDFVIVGETRSPAARCVQGLRKSPGANRFMSVSQVRGSSARH